MKKSLFYYSDEKMKYVEIKGFYRKFVSLIALFSLVFALILFSAYVVINNYVNPKSTVTELQKENKILKENYLTLSEKISTLYSQIDKINDNDKALRLAVNLEPLSPEEKGIGIGGTSFEKLDASRVSSLNDLISTVDKELSNLNTKVSLVKQNYDEIDKQLEMNKKLYDSIPALLPANGPIGDKFGMRLHPILKVRRMHTGIDIVVNTGASVYAAGKGKVIKTGYRSGYGKTIEIDHGFGYTTLYAHLSKIKVKKGQTVERGELIGVSGQTGSFATGPHLHYEVKHNGVHLNPRNFIFTDINSFEQLAIKSE